MIEHYQTDFKALMNRNSSQPEFIRTLRYEAYARFAELGFPSTKMEDWRFTNVSPIAKTRFYLPHNTISEPSQKTLSSTSFDGCRKVVVYNGRLIPKLSNLSELDETVTISTLSQAIQDTPELILPYLSKKVLANDQAFVAWNTAFMDEGIFLQIKSNQIIETPLHLIFISEPHEVNKVFHQKNLIRLGVNSQATIIEHYIGLNEQPYLTNGVTEIHTEDNAILYHLKIQQEAESAFHVSNLQIYQNENSQVSSHHFIAGGKLTRNEIKVVLDGEGSDCTLNGLTLSKTTQHMDNHTIIEHVKPSCSSRECFKNILNDSSRGVFNGLIVVRPEAQKTDANQVNKNLLLSENALMNSNPQLEIYADDVKCSHGSTTGELDEDAIFYLRSRGIDPVTAQSLLIRGFANEILDQLPTPVVKDKLSSFLQAWLATNIGPN